MLSPLMAADFMIQNVRNKIEMAREQGETPEGNAVTKRKK